MGTRRIGFSTSEYGRDYRIGYGLSVLNQERVNLELDVDAYRRESLMLGGVDEGVPGGASLGWRDEVPAACRVFCTRGTGATPMTR